MHIVDTTLRDGEQQAGIALNMDDKVKIAILLDYIGVSQIEAGTPSIGGVECETIKKIASLGLQSKIAAWNRMNLTDIQASMECGVAIIHMSVPVSDLHIQKKLKKDRAWVKEHMRVCIDYIINNGFIAHVGLEDASRGNRDFLEDICKIAKDEGASRVRYADTVGVLMPKKASEAIAHMKQKVNLDLGIHTHNDFGMAVANSLAALRAGAQYVDCTIGGVGERSGNCNLRHFLLACDQQKIISHDVKPTFNRLLEVEEEIMNIFYKK